MKNEICMNCRSPRLERFIDLGEQPNGNHFPSFEDFDSEPKFPFAMDVCLDCWQVQLEEFPSAEFMFANHPYVTGVNMPVVSHFDQMVQDALRKFPFPKNSLVIDIGANDGTLLKRFREAGMRAMGVDPGQRTGKLAREEGITICETFWDETTANSLKQLNLKPDIITATAVFYHVEDIHSFLKGLSAVMHDKTIFLAQCVYMKDVLEKIQFDHFYHEHTLMHTLIPLERLFAEYGLRMVDVDFYPVHGGSFALYVAKEDSPYETKPSVATAIEKEKAAGVNVIATYHEFTKKVQSNRNDLVELLNQLKKEDKTVYALGAPLKGSTLLNYCGIGPDLVELATEVNRFKIGKYTPGTHIPIIFEEAVEKQPDYYLVLSWNFLDFFIEKYSDFLRDGGKMIVPHPEVRIIDKSALS
jgi:hypothetical protein